MKTKGSEERLGITPLVKSLSGSIKSGAIKNVKVLKKDYAEFLRRKYS